MENKTEEKIKYFLENKSENSDLYDFSIPINQFEETLKAAINILPASPFRNGYKLYGINNKYFKIFHDGSCFGYILKKIEINKIDIFFQYKMQQQQIYNDDFAGLKTYWVEELYEDIVFKLDDQMNIIFSKMINSSKNYVEYSIFMESKNTSTDVLKYKKIIESLFEKRNDDNIF